MSEDQSAADDARLARRYREEASQLVAFVHQISDPRIKADLLELAHRYLELARNMETPRVA